MCPRASPLTLTRVLKNPTQGEEVERARKRKRAVVELPREATPIVEEELEFEEEGGGVGFKDYPKQPVLSLSVKEVVLAHNRAE